MLIITKRYEGTAFALETEVLISTPAGNTHFSCNALWDTGAMASMVTQDVAKALALPSDGFAEVAGFHGTDVCPSYEISVTFLQTKGLHFEKIKVVGAIELDGCGLLIGMDIISQLDFAITNVNGNTTHSIRFPSMKEIDFENDGDGSPGSTVPTSPAGF